jgi:hypothetical protein
MTDSEGVLRTFEADWERLDQEERNLRLANHTLIELQKIYAALSSDQRQVVDSILGDWVLSDNERRQFDGESLIDHFHITAALPALRSAVGSTVDATDAPTAYRREKLQRLIEALDPRAGRASGEP